MSPFRPAVCTAQNGRFERQATRPRRRPQHPIWKTGLRPPRPWLKRQAPQDGPSEWAGSLLFFTDPGRQSFTISGCTVINEDAVQFNFILT